MRIFLYLLITFSLFMCSSEEEPKNEQRFITDTKVITSSMDTLYANYTFVNNSIIQTIEHTNITSSMGDFEVLLKAGSKAGFFQTDTTVYMIIYNGMARVTQYNKNRYISIKTINNKYYTLNSGNIILQTFGNSQQLSTTQRGLIVDGESILLGELFHSDKEKEEIMYLSKAFLDNSKSWLDSTTYNALNLFYLKPGNYPMLTPFLKRTYVNTKMEMKLTYEKRHPEDVIDILSYEIPEDAELKKGKIYWNPTEVGKYKFSFILTDKKDTVESYCFVRVANSLRGEPNISTRPLKDGISEVIIDMSNIYSEMTNSDGLKYRVTGRGASGFWTSSKIVTIRIKNSGTRNYKVEVASLNDEEISRDLSIYVPPNIVVKNPEKPVEIIDFFSKDKEKTHKESKESIQLLESKKRDSISRYKIRENINAYKNLKHYNDSTKVENKTAE